MMPPPRTRRLRRILVGLDFSRASAGALRYAAAVARAAGGRVVAMHVVDPLLTAAAAHAYGERLLADETRLEIERFARRTLGADAATAIECVAVVGTARQALIAEARRRHADLVVLGTSGRGVSKTFLGSTAEALLRRYDGAVLVVPPRCSAPAGGWPGGSIVAAVASGRHHRAMLAAAARAAHLFGAWLHVVDPAARPARGRWHPAPLIVLPLPAAARLQSCRQGTAAYGFVRQSAVPVLVTHTGHRIGHPEVSRPAA